MPGDARPAAAGGPRPRTAHVSLLLGGLVALTVIGSSAVAVALPSLAAELQLTTAGSAWVLAAFSLTFSVCTALFGRLADLVGLRLPLRIGAVLFAAGSLVAASADSFALLVAGRLLQGTGAGAVPVLAVAIIAARFAEQARARALGSLTAVVTIVSASGPLIGGALTELVSWRAVLALPAVALALAEPVARLAPGGRGAGGRLDIGGALLVAASVGSLALLLQAGSVGGGARGVAALVALCGVTFALAGRHILTRPGGFLPRAVVTNSRLMLAGAAGSALIAAYIAGLFAIPKILTAADWSPLQIGIGLLPAALFGAIVSRVSGTLTARTPRHRLVAAFGAMSTLGLLVAAAGAAHPPVLIGGFALVVAGFGGGQVPLVDAVPGLVAPELRGIALGTFNLVFFTGGAVGAATAGGLAETLGLPWALACLALLPAVAPAAATWALRRPQPA
jgi:MFS family permease